MTGASGRPRPGRRLVPAYLAAYGRAGPARTLDRLSLLHLAATPDGPPRPGATGPATAPAVAPPSAAALRPEERRLLEVLRPGALPLAEAAVHLRLPSAWYGCWWPVWWTPDTSTPARPCPDTSCPNARYWRRFSMDSALSSPASGPAGGHLADMDQTLVKLLVAGPFGVGKTTFIRTLSEIAPLHTEEVMTRGGALVDDLAGLREKSTTTVAIDFGRRTLPGDVVLYLFGAPGQRRFQPLWQDIARARSARWCWWTRGGWTTRSR